MAATIRQSLADEILFGNLEDGGLAKVTMKNEKLVIRSKTS
jgi:hypothetical protein